MQDRFENPTRSSNEKKSDDTQQLVIYFCGTGNPGENFEQAALPVLTKITNKVTTIFVQGCEHPEVCNSVMDPNLAEFAERFTKKVFRTQNGELFLTPDALQNLKVGIKYSTEFSPDKPIGKIFLTGYSRGAVTTLEVAKELNKLQKTSDASVPVRIIAEQPVPGNYTDIFPNSVAGHAENCRKATNIESATVILAAYAPQLAPELGSIQEKMHSNFFSQMVPQFPDGLNPKLILVPRRHHWTNFMAGEAHLLNELMKGLHEEGFISAHTVQPFTYRIHECYNNYSFRLWALPAPSQLQHIFNIHNKAALYQHIDEYHPAPYLRDGFNFKENETLRQAWDRQNQSWYSDKQTKLLLEKIDAADNSDPDTLKEVYDATKNWLQHSKSDATNHELVVSLRSQLYYILHNDYYVPNLDAVAVERVARAHRSSFFSSLNPSSLESIGDYFENMNPSRPK